MHNPEDYRACLIPKPASISQSSGNFTLSHDTRIVAQKDNPEITAIAQLLSSYLREVGGFEISASDTNDPAGTIQLTLNNDSEVGEEGYELSINSDSIRLSASNPRDCFMQFRLCGSCCQPILPRR